ncbi:MAG: pyruvate:ferredoxin (flavodoxin) oxidoreductase [Clostridia bacterium]
MAKVMKTMDGNSAAAHVAYAFTDVTAIFPITPSSPMAEQVDEMASAGKKNIFGQAVLVAELQSEAGAAGALHGALVAGSLTTTFTASQGLLLMIPNMYKIAGEQLPGVFHVTARAIAGHALSIFGDHSDVMACRQTGFAMLASGSVQEAMDLAAVTHLSAISASMPFLHFFDGFRTSHEIQKIEVLSYEDIAKLIDQKALATFKSRALNPEHPKVMGTAQNPDIFFQAKEASNMIYDRIPTIVEGYMEEINKITGRNYQPFNYYGHPEAERLIVAMGSVTETAEEVVDYLTEKGEKVGLIKVHLYRPFSAKHFMKVVPSSVKTIAVLDRTKEPGARDPLFLDVCEQFFGKKNPPTIVGGRYGLGSKDTTPNQIIAVYENLKKETPKDNFTMGIVDDVTNSSLELGPAVGTNSVDTISCKFWGLGSDGTVGANKSAIKIIGDNTDLYAQGYFSYDSKKSGGVTISHLRFGKAPIRSPYLVQRANFISCSTQAYVHQYDLLAGIKDGGTFLLNTEWKAEELEKQLPASMKKAISEKKVKFFTIDATSIASEIGLGNRTNMIMQAAFFKLSQVIELDLAINYLKDSIQKAYGKKGEQVVAMNNAAVDKGIDALVEINIPTNWANAQETNVKLAKETRIETLVRVINRQEGDSLPVSAFVDGYEDGHFPVGTSTLEKRGIATNVPSWISEKCIQCNQCSFVCPHAAIRPFLLDADEVAAAPSDFISIAAKGKEFEKLNYRIQVSTMDCTGCGNCVNDCPKQALELKHQPEQAVKEIPNWDYAVNKVSVKANLTNTSTVKGSQFAQPLLEFSGACAGCGETPYVKVITQLYGDRMMVANATGCSSIWGASAPSFPYCTNSNGCGPAWANSLFEDNAEFGLGMALATTQKRNKISDLMGLVVDKTTNEELKRAAEAWITGREEAALSKEASADFLLAASNAAGADKEVAAILEDKDQLVKKSQWIIGGDGWAYDIGYGGLDHVIASGEDVNILVLDTEVYSNTGGQSSKATPAAAIAKFAASGKKVKKKDLGMMAMSYGYVYVAQVAMGANKAQFMKAIQEAESYPGPSLIIAYAPCVNHGIKIGMGKTQEREKQAVEAGYWHLFRFNPLEKAAGNNPFSLDSKPPIASFREFLNGEVRYTSLIKANPDKAEAMYGKAEEDAKERYQSYERLTKF